MNTKYCTAVLFHTSGKPSEIANLSSRLLEEQLDIKYLPGLTLLADRYASRETSGYILEKFNSISNVEIVDIKFSCKGKKQPSLKELPLLDSLNLSYLSKELYNHIIHEISSQFDSSTYTRHYPYTGISVIHDIRIIDALHKHPDFKHIKMFAYSYAATKSSPSYYTFSTLYEALPHTFVGANSLSFDYNI